MSECLRLVEYMKVDYSAAAELFVPRTRGARRRPLGYRRFATAAEAIRFAVEDLSATHSFGPWMQVGDERFNTEAIRNLYESSDYPLLRAGEKQVSKRGRKRRIGRPAQ
jgi:hypothetical protein